MKRFFSLMLAAAVAFGATAALAADNELTKKEKEEGWILLFNGKDYTGWKNNNDKEVVSAVEDGAMQTKGQGGYIVLYEKPFDNFILKCDVKMEDPCNSGIFFRIGDKANPVHTGFEIQVMTSKNTGPNDYGSLYDIVPPTKLVGNGPGKWDSVEVRACDADISVKINGQLVMKTNIDQFDEPGERAVPGNHKYKLDGKPIAVKDFPRKGWLGFQDHGHKCWYKNVKLLPLKSCEEEKK